MEKKEKKMLSLHGLHSMHDLHGLQSAESAFWGDRDKKAAQRYSTLYFDFMWLIEQFQDCSPLFLIEQHEGKKMLC